MTTMQKIATTFRSSQGNTPAKPVKQEAPRAGALSRAPGKLPQWNQQPGKRMALAKGTGSGQRLGPPAKRSQPQASPSTAIARSPTVTMGSPTIRRAPAKPAASTAVAKRPRAPAPQKREAKPFYARPKDPQLSPAPSFKPDMALASRMRGQQGSQRGQEMASLFPRFPNLSFARTPGPAPSPQLPPAAMRWAQGLPSADALFGGAPGVPSAEQFFGRRPVLGGAGGPSSLAMR